ncbi:MAG: hypothetical protein AB8B51_08145 [Sedimentitalea sp.]
MFEMLLLMLSVSFQAAGTVGGAGATPPPSAVATAPTQVEPSLPESTPAPAAPALPSFGAQTTEAAPAPALPSFGADTTDTPAPALPSFGVDTTDTPAPPAFPTFGTAETEEDVAAAPPAFLAPTEAAPAFLAPKDAAAPAFLAPAPAPATPSFLAPAPAPTAAAPAPAPAPGYQAEPQVATGKFTSALEIKPILEATRGSWVAMRDADGIDQLYVSHLWAWRCGMHEIRIGLNGAPPTPWPMPPCQLQFASPNAIPNDALPLQTFPYQSIQTIEVQILLDDLTLTSATFLRRNIMIP